MTTTLTWQVKDFSQLTNNELYDLLKLRVDVFVVEQCCYYPDIDNLDRHPQTLHLLGYQGDMLAAYARVLAQGVCYPDYIAIGRVVTSPKARGNGLGHQLMSQALATCQQYFKGSDIKISAQQHLEKFYQQHGFTTVSERYFEDGIPHIAMKRAAV